MDKFEALNLLRNGDVLPIGAETQFGIVRGVRPIEKAQEAGTHMKAGLWYILELSIGRLHYFHEQQLMEVTQRNPRSKT